MDFLLCRKNKKGHDVKALSSWGKKKADEGYAKKKARMAKPMSEYDSDSDDGWTENDRSAIKIQALARCYNARLRRAEQWQACMTKATVFYNKFYGYKNFARGRAKAFAIRYYDCVLHVYVRVHVRVQVLCSCVPLFLHPPNANPLIPQPCQL